MHTTTKLPLSVVMITRNAERTLPHALTSVVDWAGEIVMVDSGSTDTTLAIANQFNCCVYHHPFAGYGPQKQFAIAQATYDWVLLLDADERLDNTLQQSVCQLFKTKPEPSRAFSLPRSLIFLGRTLRFSGENRRPILRLFNRQQGHMNDALVHESISVSGPITTLKGELLHDSYTSLREYIDKMNAYTSLSAENMARAGRRSPVGLLPVRFVLTFLKIYVLRGGFLDGFSGFAWAFLSAAYPVIKYTKLYELNRKKQPVT